MILQTGKEIRSAYSLRSKFRILSGPKALDSVSLEVTEFVARSPQESMIHHHSRIALRETVEAGIPPKVLKGLD